MKSLQSRGCQVFLVSGGFRAIIEPIASVLGIPQGHVFANTILFKVMPVVRSKCNIMGAVVPARSSILSPPSGAVAM